MQPDAISRFNGWARLAEFEGTGLNSNKAPTIAEVVAAIGWQPLTVGGAFSGALEKRLRLNIDPSSPIPAL